MELRQLRYFVAIAEERHFGRAARRLKIATPTLSQQLRALERNLGVVLATRQRPGTVTLTPAGEVLLRHARILLARAERAQEEVKAANGKPEQLLLRVAHGAEGLLARPLRRLTSDRSRFGVITVSSSSTDALQAIREERTDAAIIWDGFGGSPDLTSTVLFDVDVHLALPAGHRLAGHASVDVADLAEETIVLFPRTLSPHVWGLLHRHLLPQGVSRPDHIYTEPNATGPIGVLRGVAAGRGVAPVVGPLAHQTRHEGVVLRPLNPPLTLPLQLVWREPANDALHRVVALLQSECRPNADLRSARGLA